MLMIATTIPTVESLKNSSIKIMVPNTPLTSTTSNWTETQKLLALDGATDDEFSSSVSLDGDTAIIGAPFDDDNGIDSGSVYVFTRTGSTWTQQAKLLASDGAADDRFGWSVSLDDNTVLIGAIWDDDNGGNSGSAYVYTRTGSTWTQQEKLLASDGSEHDSFANSVSLNSDTALIGTYLDDDNGDASGSVYVFKRIGTTWTQQAKLLASDNAQGDLFGKSVSIYGETALIGAVQDDDNGAESGSAYVFTCAGTSWTQQAKLLASDGTPGDAFGYSVSLYGETALIGANYKTSGTGATYVFTRTGNTWTQQAKLIASDGDSGDNFGKSVSYFADTALIGALNHDDGNNSGSAYMFTRTGTTWTEQQKLLAADGTAGDWFGWSVSLNINTCLIGAVWDDDNGGNSGSAYVFTKESENQPPNPPTIDGPASGKKGVSYNYNFVTVDPEGDDVYYWINWSDGSPATEWIGPYPSGQLVIISHTFSQKGTFIIICQAKDAHNALSDWGTLSVTMPCSYIIPFQQFWERLFERFPHAFPLLKHLMGY